MKIDQLSPLRYPGGKKYLAPYIESVLLENMYTGCEFYEPFCGGASISLYLLEKERISKAILIEKDPLVYSFWKAAFTQTDELCERIRSLEVNIETWHKFRNSINDPSLSVLDMALTCIFLNRTNYSGILSAGPIGGINQNSRYAVGCRFNKDAIIAKIKYVSAFKKKVKVVLGDAVKFLQKNANSIQENGFVYVDPPYFVNGKRLYREYYSDNHHLDLARVLNSSKFPFVVSYDDHEFIKTIFKEQKIVPILLNYAISRSYKVTELLISNIRLPEPEYVGITNARSESETTPLVLTKMA